MCLLVAAGRIAKFDVKLADWLRCGLVIGYVDVYSPPSTHLGRVCCFLSRKWHYTHVLDKTRAPKVQVSIPGQVPIFRPLRLMSINYIPIEI